MVYIEGEYLGSSLWILPMHVRLRSCLLFVVLCVGTQGAALAQDAISLLAKQFEPWRKIAAGEVSTFHITGSAQLPIDGKPQALDIALDRWDDDSFDLRLTHSEYAVHFRRRVDGIAMALPKHKVVFLGQGDSDAEDHLQPKGLAKRVVGNGTDVQLIATLLRNSNSEDLAGALIGLAKLSWDGTAWHAASNKITFDADKHAIDVQTDDGHVHLQSTSDAGKAAAIDAWPDYRIQKLDRKLLEKHLTRGLRRGLEVALPSMRLIEPSRKEQVVDHGKLSWVDGSRVVLLRGTPEQIGTAHGKLLKTEAMRCIDSVVHMFGTIQTVATGRWFPDDLASAYKRLSPHIPERHKVETRALARSLDVDEQLLETTNVFPELFHCSGFALFGKATQDGKLYHGRVLDYMTVIGLQDAATTFIIAPEGCIPFANIGYAGFIGSVSGMNTEKISLGEMGGRGEGQWDGAPMATLMRRGLEECRSLEEVKALWKNNPRTCEYYYVFADGETKTAVGVAATPDKLEFVEPGAGHPLLGEGIPDAVVLSAGSRLEELRSRVKNQYGSIDAEKAQGLMCRPVAMNSNLHNVLFVPEDGVFYVSNADHKRPAADRPYSRIHISELLQAWEKKQPSKEVTLTSRYRARDSFAPPPEKNADALACIQGLRWDATEFEVQFEPAKNQHGDCLVRFPTPVPSGDAPNDLVAMEWYQARDASKEPTVAPAAIIVHESGSGMTVGRLIANGLRQKGVHCFMVQLPYYGDRQGGLGKPKGDKLVAALRQGIADVRRARDAVAAIPLVDANRISLQGTSLGGFVTATTAGLDPAFHRVFILLAGGDLYDVMMQGKKDAAKMREEMTKNGVDENQLKTMLQSIEPLRLAHRLVPQKTYMFSGKFDDVVPLENSLRLAKAAGLDEDHHMVMLADHYSGIIYLPTILQQIHDRMIEPAPSSVDAAK